MENVAPGVVPEQITTNVQSIVCIPRPAQILINVFLFMMYYSLIAMIGLILFAIVNGLNRMSPDGSEVGIAYFISLIINLALIYYYKKKMYLTFLK